MRFYLSSFKLGKDIQVLKKWLEHNDRKILLIPNARDAKADTAEKREKRLHNKVMLEEYETLKSNNVEFFDSYHETDYGKVEFGIYDLDRNMIIVSAEIK